MLKNKKAGFYLIIISMLICAVSLVRFLMWAPKHGTFDWIVIAGFAVGLIADAVLLAKEYPILIVIATAAYSIGAVKILTDSVGSFVDAFQGIQMFGDATQVHNIISIAAVAGVGILISVIAAFCKRVNE